MIIILTAAVIFAFGLGMILMFRSVIRVEDELDRRIAEVLRGAGEDGPVVEDDPDPMLEPGDDLDPEPGPGVGPDPAPGPGEDLDSAPDPGDQA